MPPCSTPLCAGGGVLRSCGAVPAPLGLPAAAGRAGAGGRIRNGHDRGAQTQRCGAQGAPSLRCGLLSEVTLRARKAEQTAQASKLRFSSPITPMNPIGPQCTPFGSFSPPSLPPSPAQHAYALLAALASTSSVFLEEPEVRVPLAEGLTDAMEEFKDKPEIPAVRKGCSIFCPITCSIECLTSG